MLQVQFGIRKNELPGFQILFARVAKEVQIAESIGQLKVVEDYWSKDSDDAYRVSFYTAKPMAAINFVAQMFAPFLVRSTDEDRKDVRIMLTNPMKFEYEEFRW
jgi:hypothetical protein